MSIGANCSFSLAGMEIRIMMMESRSRCCILTLSTASLVSVASSSDKRTCKWLHVCIKRWLPRCCGDKACPWKTAIWFRRHSRTTYTKLHDTILLSRVLAVYCDSTVALYHQEELGSLYTEQHVYWQVTPVLT